MESEMSFLKISMCVLHFAVVSALWIQKTHSKLKPNGQATFSVIHILNI